MFSRSFRRKIGSTFLTLAAPSSMISLCGSNKVCASKEFLNSKLFQAMLKVFENNDKDNENNNNIIRRLDCDSLWNNQSTKKGTNVETLSKKKLETLVALYYIANKYKSDKAKALLFDVETVLQGNMEKKVEEFFKSEFFKKYCKSLLENCYIEFYNSIVKKALFLPSEKDLKPLDYYNPAYNAKIEEIVSILSSSNYKEALCNGKGEYEEKIFSKRFLILNGFYTFMLQDLSLLEKFKFREIYFVGKVFVSAKKLLENKDAFGEDPQISKDNFVFILKYSKDLIESKFLNLQQVLSVIKALETKVGDSDGVNTILNAIEKSKSNIFESGTTKKIIYAMADNYRVIDKLVNSQQSSVPLLNAGERYYAMPIEADAQTNTINVPSTDDLFKSFTDPIFASSKNAF